MFTIQVVCWTPSKGTIIIPLSGEPKTLAQAHETAHDIIEFDRKAYGEGNESVLFVELVDEASNRIKIRG